MNPAAVAAQVQIGFSTRLNGDHKADKASKWNVLPPPNHVSSLEGASVTEGTFVLHGTTAGEQLPGNRVPPDFPDFPESGQSFTPFHPHLA